MPPAEILLEQVAQLRQENATLKAQLEWFKKHVFGGGKSDAAQSAEMA